MFQSEVSGRKGIHKTPNETIYYWFHFFLEQKHILLIYTTPVAIQTSNWADYHLKLLTGIWQNSLILTFFNIVL